MSLVLIEDYVATQGLCVSADEVLMAQLAAEAVMNMPLAEVDRGLLWYGDAAAGVALADVLVDDAAHHDMLRRAFMALDGLFERQCCQSAVLYVLLPAHVSYWGNHLLRLVALGQPIEAVLGLDETDVCTHIAPRAAQTGWLQCVDDVRHWMDRGELVGDVHERCHSQMALPLYGDDGCVQGVLYVEGDKAGVFDAHSQAQWVGLALALVGLMREVHRRWTLLDDDEMQLSGKK